ncbi:Flavodoxin reductases (ferredoxin-NADPH reductases) family 1; Vanillate O-demethylase oxidoreductase [Klebsiella pneumoniae IS22]|nr:Flavodoxin reductases (ferredoxin-NADPH reductases) family 1; Vanillate O-demethylase oxidoreductase [Klebsiella pneumoniae IS22]
MAPGAKNLAVRLVSAEGQPLRRGRPAPISISIFPALIRQYSLTGSPAERDRYLLCIARESQSRGGSRYIHDTLRPGQPLMISAPRNHFPLHEGGHVVLLAAGIGITPLLAMAHARARPAPALRCTITLAVRRRPPSPPRSPAN